MTETPEKPQTQPVTGLHNDNGEITTGGNVFGNISTGGGSVAGRDQTNIIIHQGLSLADARQLALDVFEANFFRLAGIAQQVARQRAEELTENFLRELAEKNPSGLETAVDPDMQHNLFTAQQGYVRSGDKDLGEILVGVLVERSKNMIRDVRQIALNEAIIVASKLTSEQYDILSLILLLGSDIGPRMVNFDDFFTRPANLP